MSRNVNAHAAASAQTRDELLEAGLRLLMTVPASTAFGHLTASKICAEAGRTTGAFFHQWPTTEAYLEEFAAYVLRPELAVNLNGTVQAMLELMGKGETFNAALVEAAQNVPDLTAQDPQSVIELLLWNRALHEPDFRANMAQLYPTLDEGAGQVYEGLMDLLGRELRPPFTAPAIAALFNAVAQGLSIRTAMTPDIYPKEVFGWVMVTLIPLVTREPDDTRDAHAFTTDIKLALPDASA